MSVALKRWRGWLCLLSCTLLMLASTGLASGAEGERRVALVLGNADYQNAESLANPINDARMIARSLGGLGFEVDLKTNLDQFEMRMAVREFGLRAAQADIALVYYAGHGVQVDNENYLLAVDARLQRELDLLYEALPLDLILSEVEQASTMGLVILDACRDNPLADKLSRSMGIKANRVGRGLARINDVPSDTMVAFATRANAVAIDGEGRNSPYTTALLQHFETPGLELSLMFRKVRDSVLKSTAGLQEPFTYGSLGGEPFYLKPAQPNRRPTVATPQPLTVADNETATPFEIAGIGDPDGDPLSVEITEVPRKGSVTVGGKKLEKGSVVTVDQLAAATYSPERGSTGRVGSFAFLVQDNRGAIVTASIPVTVQQSNRAPVAPKEVALKIGHIPLNLREPVDPDGDPLKVTVTKTPHEGSVFLGYKPLFLGDQVAASDVPSLVFHPGSTFTGDAGIFEIQIEDSSGAIATTSVRIALPGFSKKAPAEAAQETEVAAATTTDAGGLVAPEPLPAAETEEAQPAVAALPAVAEESTQDAPPFVGNYRVLTRSNVRSGPDASFSRIATLERDDRVSVSGQVIGSDWFEIQTDKGLSGFIYGDLIEKVAEEQVAARSMTEEDPAEPSASSIQVAVGIFEKGPAFKDCEFCPNLIRVPPGSFVMGSKTGHSSERPQREVQIAEAFAIGVYEVTLAEWNACVIDGGCRFRPEFDQAASASLPVFNVSWDDVHEYLDWLSNETGKDYRLPSETEWEYAARAGTDTTFWWGSEAGQQNASCRNCGGDWSREQPPAIGSFRANPFGIHDMNGSVAEWVADCWNNSYAGKPPKTAEAWTNGDCSRRVLRGGSWRNDASYLTSTSRFMYDASVRYIANGFRVARPLD